MVVVVGRGERGCDSSDLVLGQFDKLTPCPGHNRSRDFDPMDASSACGLGCGVGCDIS